MWLIFFTILSYICFGFILDVSTHSLGKNELKDADLLKNIQLEVNVFKDNYHKLLLIVQQDGKEIKFLKKQNQDLKQKLDNTINKTDALMTKDESFDQKIGVIQHNTLRKLKQIKARNRKSRNSVSSSLTLFNNSLQEVIKDTNNFSKGHHLLIGREEMKIFEKKIRDENDKVIGEIESSMDSFMKNVLFSNTLVTDKLQKMTEDVGELKTSVTDMLLPHIRSIYSKIEKTVSDAEELKTDVTHQESSIARMQSNLISMSSKLEKIVSDVAELKINAELSCRQENFTCTKQFQCIPASKKSDGVDDCCDKTDEDLEGCANYTMCYNGGTRNQLSNGDMNNSKDSNICVCAEGYLGKQCEYSDGKDTSFVIIFHNGKYYSSTLPRIMVASENTTGVLIFDFKNNKKQSITMDKYNTEYKLSKNVLPSDGIHLAGVEVHSDVRVNLFGSLNELDDSEGFLPMPSRFASTKYIVPSPPAYTNTFLLLNLLALSPIYQNTAVSIHLKLKSDAIMYQSKRYENNDTITLVINKYNTLQLSHTSDLSGTMVTSSKPIIVVSGSQYLYSLSDMDLSGTFIESVLPTNQLDNMFITPYISTHLKNTVRIQAVNSTKLTIITGNIKTFKTLNERDFFDFHYTMISFIASSEDILVMSYPYRLDGEFGDPSNFMMTIPGVNQYLYEYDFVVTSGSCISITVQSNSIDGFLFDGKSANSRSSLYSISEGSNHFSTFSMCITGGKHHMVHRKKIRFGLWIYGDKIDFNGSCGYGYPAGMAYKTFN